MRQHLLLLVVFFSGVSSFVYTCNEVKKMLDGGDVTINSTRACVVPPAQIKPPHYVEPYASDLTTTYFVDTNNGSAYRLSELLQTGSFCLEGKGPWMIKSDDPSRFMCSSDKLPYVEIIFLFMSNDAKIVQLNSELTKFPHYGMGTYVFVAPEGAMMFKKMWIDEDKELVFQLFTGAGQNEAEERFELTPEKFITGDFTLVIGPVTTLVIDTDVTIGLSIESFEEEYSFAPESGTSTSIMASGRANNLQSSRPYIKLNSRYLIDENLADFDNVKISGTLTMDPKVSTTLAIDCTTGTSSYKFSESRDVLVTMHCTRLQIGYIGSIAPENIGRSSEVIYLQIESMNGPPQSTTANVEQTTSRASFTTSHGSASYTNVITLLLVVLMMLIC